MKRFHAVVFDMDGLLLDSEAIAFTAFMDACRYFGIGDQKELFVRCIGTNQALGEQILRQGLAGKIAGLGHNILCSLHDVFPYFAGRARFPRPSASDNLFIIEQDLNGSGFVS